jgi:hypothetical protein
VPVPLLLIVESVLLPLLIVVSVLLPLILLVVSVLIVLVSVLMVLVSLLLPLAAWLFVELFFVVLDLEVVVVSVCWPKLTPATVKRITAVMNNFFILVFLGCEICLPLISKKYA